MQKQAPTLGRVMAMVLFALSCFGILLYLWVSFGGSTPLKPTGYRFEVQMPESALLVNEAPVRMAGLDVGQVKEKSLETKGGQTVVIEMDESFAPIPSDSRVTLRQKSLLGQIYIEITPGSQGAPDLEDGGKLSNVRVQETVDFDEVISTFDKPTRDNYRGWIKELAKAIRNGRGEDLSDAFANFVAFTEDGNSVLEILDEQDPALRRLIKNTGVTLGAINRRYGEFGQFVTNANDFFGALASRNDALAETISVFPTFLNESRLTFDRLREFAINTRPLVRELQPVALQLRPTLRDLGKLAPDLEHLFTKLEPVIDESGDTLPEAEKFLRCLNGSDPCDEDPQGNKQPGVLESLYPYLEELNPILTYLNYYQAQVGAFFTNGVGSLFGTLEPLPGEGPRHYLRQFGVSNARGVGIQTERQVWERGNAYPSPNFYNRFRPLGAVEAWDCDNTGEGEVEDPVTSPPNETAPPCLIQPPQMWGGEQYPNVNKGEDELREPPQGNEGTGAAVPNDDDKP